MKHDRRAPGNGARLLREFVIFLGCLLTLATGVFIARISHRNPAQELYHKAWEETARNIYDPATLGNWKSWEHVYVSGSITNKDADSAIREMLASVHDRYTVFVRPAAFSNKENSGHSQPAPAHIPAPDPRMLQPPADIGYVRLESFRDISDVYQFKQSLKRVKDCRAVIVDLRDNLGGVIDNAVAAATLFLDQGTIVNIRRRVPGAGYNLQQLWLSPDALHLDERLEGSTELHTNIREREANLLGARPVALLVNGYTASAAEILTGALKDNHRAILVGTTTFGKGIGQIGVALPESTLLQVTTLRVYTPGGYWVGDGGNSESHGIEPDVVVEASESMEFGTVSDNQLQKAIEILSARLGGKKP